MSINRSRKSKSLNLFECPAFPNNFVVRLNNSTFEKCNYKQDAIAQPPVTKRNDTENRWTSHYIPNLKGIPNGRMKPRLSHVFSREDTFDADFMMPSRVREVLQSEGLENRVINSAIGRAEAKHEDTWKTITQDSTEPVGKNEKSSMSLVATKSPAWLSSGSGSDSQTHSEAQTSNHNVGGWRVCTFSTSSVYKDLQLNMDEIRLETDRRQWLNEQAEEQMFSGRKHTCPRVVLISSKIHKCQQLSAICQEDVLPLIYDFDIWSFADIIENLSRRLHCYRKHCKARSIMIYCQGGPGYIYLLRNYAITPQKLQKPSYRSVVEFWKSLGCLLSKLRPAEAVIHVVGFKLLDDEQGHKLLPMIQGIMYPNIVRVEVPDEEKETGRLAVGLYFLPRKYKLWKSQNTIKPEDETPGQAGTKQTGVKQLTLSIG